MADDQSGPRTPPPAVDLRRSRAPQIDIVEWTTYDYLLSLHVALVAPQSELHEFDIGAGWVTQARARCDAADPRALDVLGLYVGDERPSSLRATLLSLIGQCPTPERPGAFLDWLRNLPAPDFAEALLDQEGLSADWPNLLRTALAERAADGGAPGAAEQRLLADYPIEARPVAQRVVSDVETVRAEVIAALQVWYDAVFADEEARLVPLLAREAEAMRHRREEQSQHTFVEREMRGVEWQRPAGLRRFIFAPSYFCKPAVFYHFWRGTLTFCAPVEPALEGSSQQPGEPDALPLDLVTFFQMLGDETRLRILRRLSQRQMYLTELAEALNLKKATIKHHMVRLRGAGMVTLHDRVQGEHKTYYTLRPDIARRARLYLDGFLRPDDGRPG